jgi:hypothetical protein
MTSLRTGLATFSFAGTAAVFAGVVPHYDLPDVSDFAPDWLPEFLLGQLRRAAAASALLASSAVAFAGFVVLHLRRRSASSFWF